MDNTKKMDGTTTLAGDYNMTSIEKKDAMKEPHKDDPKHEAKEVAIAGKQKKLAEKIIDMHKEEVAEHGEKVKISKSGQWSLEKDAKNPLHAPKQTKVKELQAQIDAGTYKPNAEKIADKMLKDEGEFKKDGEQVWSRHGDVVRGKKPKIPHETIKMYKNGQWSLDKKDEKK